MPLVFAAIAPHGFPIIPELSDDADGALETREQMHEFGRRLRDASVDVVVIATPHGFRADDFICVSNACRGAGALHWQGKRVEQNVPFDQPFAQLLGDTAKAQGLPVVFGSYGGGGAAGVLPIDWAVITPLWFAGYSANVPGSSDVLAPKPEQEEPFSVVSVCPARNLSAGHLVQFGRALVEAAEGDGRRIAYIASCDWAHRHKESGPYGFSEAAALWDGKIVEAVKANELMSLATITPEDIQAAAMDGWPQTMILAGVIEQTGFPVDFLCYEAPSYYGMIVATYQ